MELFYERHTSCKDCIKERSKEYRKANKERLKERLKEYRKANKERIKEYYIDNKERIKESQKEYRKANKECIKEYNKEYHINNKERFNERVKEHRKDNPGLYNAYRSKRKARKLKATPSWLTKEHLNQIMEYYKLAKELQWLSEESLHVDHIVPLQGKIVCGLHVPWNLQVLPASMNLSKHNNI